MSLKLKSPKEYAQSIRLVPEKLEDLRQFNIKLDRIIRTDRGINGPHR